MYQIEFTKKAIKDLKILDRQIINIVKNKILGLSNNPFDQSLDIKKLKGFNDVYRLRFREYRIIYRINTNDNKMNSNKLLITIIKIGSRGNIYAEFK